MYKGPNFKAQHENEEVLTFWRKHWICISKSLMGFAFFNLVLLIVLWQINEGLLLSLFPSLTIEAQQWFVFFLYFLISGYLHYFFLSMFNYFLSIKIVTNLRIVEFKRTVFFKNIVDSIDIHRIVDIHYKQDGVLSTLLNYGTLELTLVSSDHPKMLTYIPNVEYYARKIMYAKRKYINEKDIDNRDIIEEELNNPQEKIKEHKNQMEEIDNKE